MHVEGHGTVGVGTVGTSDAVESPDPEEPAAAMSSATTVPLNGVEDAAAGRVFFRRSGRRSSMSGGTSGETTAPARNAFPDPRDEMSSVPSLSSQTLRPTSPASGDRNSDAEIEDDDGEGDFFDIGTKIEE